ncbi:MAG: rhodanese-like domain-containing protein [Gammaproteobacteria bacterium]|nr:rhodanese-like domain-containing protein [Gammaproteobacteria bacterium]
MRFIALIAVLIVSLSASFTAVAKPLADMTAEQVLAAEEGSLLVLDVRSDHEYDRGHVPGALHIPQQQLANRLAELGEWRNKSIVVYCESGYRASLAASLLEEEGFNNVYHLVGHMREWRDSGRAIAF